MTSEISHLEVHRPALVGHCYRMLGSAVDADDAAQETIIRAWRNWERFEERSQVRTWLYRIATNVCLDELQHRKRRARPVEEGPSGTVDSDLRTLPREHWLEPVADARAVPSDADPAERAILRQSIRLAFVAALQHLPARQRAVLLLMEVLGWQAAEVAACLDMTVAAVNSALQRARVTMSTRRGGLLQPASEEQARLVERFAAAFERYDVDALVTMLHEDATLSMPPFELWLQGADTIAQWLLGRGAKCRGSKLVRVEASGGHAYAQYRHLGDGRYEAWALMIAEVDGDRVAAMNSFLDVQTLFPQYGLALVLDPA